MHMADALVAPAVAGTMYACSVVAAGCSVKKVKIENDPQKIPTMGVMGAFVFAAQMINFTIPGTGSSGHLCGGMLLSAILGPYAGFLTMIGILLIQCLMFADGGLLALGCNIWNMAAYGCFVGGLLIWRGMMRKGQSRVKIMTASILGAILTLQLGAFSVTLETVASGITALPFATFVAVMQPIHLAIGLVEGVVTGLILVFIEEARPDLIWTGTEEKTTKKARLSIKTIRVIFVVAAAILAGVISLFASANPDGLEWSIQKITGSTELVASGNLHELSEKIQGVTALLPDYAWKNSDSQVGTSFSGVIGGAATLAVCILFCIALRFLQKKKREKRCQK